MTDKSPHGEPPAPRLTRRRKLAFGLVAACLFMFLIALLGELGMRVARGSLLSVESERRDQVSDPRAAYDEQLGWVPVESSWTMQSGDLCTIDAMGLRGNGNEPLSSDRSILVAGDSFTFCAEVSDAETWPSHLERLLGRRVWNAGVSGYGVDQAALRATRLLPRLEPDVVALAVIADDINRAELSHYYSWKPYHELDGDGIAIRGVPVSDDPPPASTLGGLRNALEQSLLATAVLKRSLPRWWNSGEFHKVHDDGVEVCRRVVRRLDESARSSGARFVLVGFGVSGRFGSNERLYQLLDLARTDGVAVLDLSRPLEERLERHPEAQERLFRPRGHYSGEANRWVAEQLARYLAD